MSHLNSAMLARKHIGLVGLEEGQVRSREFVHDCGWFDRHGNKLGFGDLGVTDLKRIALELAPGEVFVVVPEAAGTSDSDDFSGRVEVSWLSERASYAISDGRIYRVYNATKGVIDVVDGLIVWPLSRSVLPHKLIAE